MGVEKQTDIQIRLWRSSFPKNVLIFILRRFQMDSKYIQCRLKQQQQKVFFAYALFQSLYNRFRGKLDQYYQHYAVRGLYIQLQPTN